ncbi:hypothetical protein PG987_013107 [Apiospora arundinis]
MKDLLPMLRSMTCSGRGTSTKSVLLTATRSTRILRLYTPKTSETITYDHILLNTRDPVRSPIYKQQRAELVLGSVTTWESSVLYVFAFLFLLDIRVDLEG